MSQIIVPSTSIPSPLPPSGGGTGLTTVGDVGSQLITNNSGSLNWTTLHSVSDIIYIQDDFIYGRPNSVFWPWQISSNGGSFGMIDAVSGHHGILELSTSGSAGGEAWVIRYDDNASTYPYIFGDGAIEMRHIFNIPTLSSGGETYVYTFGLGQTFTGFTSSEPGSEATYFQYNSASSANWIAACRTGGVDTNASGGTATAVTTGWHFAKITINAAGSSVSFFMDGVLLGTCVSGISTSPQGPGFKMRKTAGTSARVIDIDYWSYYHNYTTPRM